MGLLSDRAFDLDPCKGEDGDDNAGVGEGEAWLK